MNASDLGATCLIAAVVVVLGALIGGVIHFEWGCRFLFVGLWSTLNVYAWQGLLSTVVFERRWGAAQLWILLKLPVLFGLGAAYVVWAGIRPASFLPGFHVVFLVIAVRIFLLTRRNRAEAARKRTVSP